MIKLFFILPTAQCTWRLYFYTNLKATIFRDELVNKSAWPTIHSKIKPILEQRNDFSPNSPEFNIWKFYNRTGHERTGMMRQCKYRGKQCKPEYWSTVRNSITCHDHAVVRVMTFCEVFFLLFFCHG